MLKIDDFGSICILEPSFEQANYHLPVPSRFKSAKTASFQVEYINTWTTEAQEAFEYSLEVWSSFISSDVPIRIQANWLELESENVLASAGPSALFSFDDGAEMNTWYGTALASAISGTDLVAEYEDLNYDIIVNVNANFRDWHFDPFTEASGNTIDFVTVILHEIGHGLGFTGSMRSSGLSNTQIGFDGFPMIYDKFIFDGDLTSILDQGKYFSSSSLYSAGTGKQNGLFFWGDISSSNNEGVPASIFTPSQWNQGSSYSHLDQNTYSNTENALMRPYVDYNYSIHSPGTLVCGMFKDMGWPLGAGCSALLTAEVETGEIALNHNKLNAGITNAKQSNSITLEISNEDLSGQLIGRAQLQIGNNFSLGDNIQFFNVDPNQRNLIQISYHPDEKGIHEDVLEIYHNDPSQTNPIKVPLKGEALAENQVVLLEQNYPNPFSLSTAIPYAIPQTSKVRLDVYDVLGKHVMTMVNSEQPAGRYVETLDSNNLSSGLYLYVINVDGVMKSGKLFVVK